MSVTPGWRERLQRLWLRLGDEILLGGEGHTEFAPLWSRATREASP